MKNLTFPLAFACALGTTATAAVVDVARNANKANGIRLKAGARVGQDSVISTGGKSKLQLSVGEKGGVVRTGSKTEAVLATEKNLSLSRGILLASSGGKGFGRESLTVQTPETQSSVKGTMLIAYQPDAYIKITCIEGKVSIRLKALLGEIISLQAGQMIIIDPAEKKLPETVEVDLKELIATSALLGGEFPGLERETLVTSAATGQANALAGGKLTATNLRLVGASPALFMDQGIEAQRVELPGTKEAAPVPGKSDTKQDDGPAAPPPVPQGYIVDGTTVFTAQSLNTPGYRPVPATTATDAGGLPLLTYNFPVSETDVPELLLRRNVILPGGFANRTIYRTDGLIQIGDGQQTNVMVSPGAEFSASGLRINDATVQTTAGSGPGLNFDVLEMEMAGASLLSNSSIGIYSAGKVTAGNSLLKGVDDLFVSAGDAVTFFNSEFEAGNGLYLDTAGPVALTDSTLTSQTGPMRVSSRSLDPDVDAIAVTNSRVTAKGGDLIVKHQGNNLSRTGITVQNSSQLQALMAGADIQLTTEGARIVVVDSSLQAGPSGQILVDTMTLVPPADSTVTMTNVTANADIIRARSYNSADRDALVVSGGNFTASSLIKFYAAGASRLRFTGDVQLNSPSSALAGKIVQVDAGGQVTAAGRVSVYSDDHRYNTGGYGNIRSSQGSSGVQPRPFSARPGF